MIGGITGAIVIFILICPGTVKRANTLVLVLTDIHGILTQRRQLSVTKELTQMRQNGRRRTAQPVATTLMTTAGKSSFDQR